MRDLALRNGHIAKVDDEDWDRLQGFKWYKTVQGYVVHSVDAKTKIILHRFVMGLEKGVGVIDHINRDRLDCRKSNLRVVTNRQNLFNKNCYKNGVSRFKGVSIKAGKETKPWLAQIQIDGKKHHIGYFDKESDAALAYDSAARGVFGEFAGLNFP